MKKLAIIFSISLFILLSGNIFFANNDVVNYRTFTLGDNFNDTKDKLNADICPLEFDQTSYFGSMDYPKNHVLKSKKMPFLPLVYFQFKDEKLAEVIIQFNKKYFSFESLYTLLVKAYGDSEIYKPKKALWKKTPGNLSLYIIWRAEEKNFQPEIVIQSGSGTIDEKKQIDALIKEREGQNISVEAVIHIPLTNKVKNQLILSGSFDTDKHNPTIRIISDDLSK